MTEKAKIVASSAVALTISVGLMLAVFYLGITAG